MYHHILIPTDGSKLAHRAVTHGLSLAKAVGAKVTVYCGPVLRHPAGPIQAANFRSAIAF